MSKNQNLTELVNDLVDRGYATDFDLLEQINTKKNSDRKLSTKDFKIDEIYCFEEPGEPNEVFLLTISSEKYHFKGIVINAFSTYTVPSWSGVGQRIRDAVKDLFKR